jgi:hypothetical protein
VSAAVRNEDRPSSLAMVTAEQLAELAENGQGAVGQPVPVNGTKFGHCPQCDEDGQD